MQCLIQDNDDDDDKIADNHDHPSDQAEACADAIPPEQETPGDATPPGGMSTITPSLTAMDVIDSNAVKPLNYRERKRAKAREHAKALLAALRAPKGGVTSADSPSVTSDTLEDSRPQSPGWQRVGGRTSTAHVGQGMSTLLLVCPTTPDPRPGTPRPSSSWGSSTPGDGSRRGSNDSSSSSRGDRIPAYWPDTSSSSSSSVDGSRRNSDYSGRSSTTASSVVREELYGPRPAAKVSGWEARGCDLVFWGQGGSEQVCCASLCPLGAQTIKHIK